ncbi:Penicillin-binding protein 4* [Ureibacillus acetophenoni]
MKEKKIIKWIKRYEENGYLNGSILIASKGEILLNKGFGIANWEHMVTNRATTKFRIGSLTKAFTALAIFQLHEKGKLSIDDYLNKYLTAFPHDDRITIYHCLTNSSGIPNYTSFPDFWSTTMRLPMTLEQLIDTFKGLPLDFEPGSKFDYSNSGYAILTAIIENVSGMTYADYIKENICIPLRLKNTGCDDGIQIVPNLASGYSYWEKPIHSAFTDLSFPLGAYGLYSTTEDLFLWEQALRSYKLLSEDLTNKMFTAYRDSYACGWMISEIFGRRCEHHFGDISGYSSDFLRFVDDEITIIFLSNLNVTPVTHLTKEMAKVIFEGVEDDSLPSSVTPIDFPYKEKIVGKYFTKEGRAILELSTKENELYVTVPKMYGVLYKFKLIAIDHSEATSTFKTELINEQLIFHFTSTGKVEHVEYKDYHDNKSIVYKELIEI